ncbi:DNA cytosine methyltransferase [Ligilactobacillus ruminis]|uniref:DNA cytosine methyltransferase n=1 Tax=Ligilactobacillus ruminis TaxID=1623 RepID=UPI0022E29B74|nr:DNA cytosine methyltransferase [Ligilactobacillus ruminis]
MQNYYDKLVNGEIIPQFAEAPSRLRRITINEARRIQTFPDNYVFCGAKTSVYKQIGNAVPCEIAKTIATAVITYLNSHSI